MEDNTEMLVRASQLYYEEGLNQSDIAKILNISRPTVSRLIEEAKRTGIVEIIVHDPIRKDPDYSNQLRNRLNIRDVIVVNGTYEYDKALKRCCQAGIQLLDTIIMNNQTIGIAWGAVPMLISEMIEERQSYNVTVVQMVGCLGSGNPNVDGHELAINLSKKLGATYANIYAPIYVQSELVRDYLLAEPQIEATLRKAMHTDLIISGIGSIDTNSSISRSGYWNDKDIEELISLGAVGHLLGRPYDINGKPISRAGHYVVGAPLEAMKGVDWSIGIAVSKDRASATLGAIKGGYINTLITDKSLAEELIALLDKEN